MSETGEDHRLTQRWCHRTGYGPRPLNKARDFYVVLRINSLRTSGKPTRANTIVNAIDQNIIRPATEFISSRLESS